MATAEQISTRALRRLNVFAAGESPGADDITSAIEALNAMISSWEADGLSGDVLPLDARFEQGVVAMLAVRLAEDYGATAGPVLVRDAQNGWSQIQSAFFAVPETRFEGALANVGVNVRFALINNPPNNYDAWSANTDYAARMYATLDGNLYECVTGGTSGSTGPTGAGSEIADGTAVWCWRRVVA